jgi:surface antigen
MSNALAGRALALCLATLVAAPLRADPPDHAPAHGYRDKERGEGRDRDEDRANRKSRHYRGYTGVEWERDYGVATGRCNTDAALTALGAAGGAVIGNRTASPENRTIATLAGAIIGGIIGNAVGDAIDEGDRACMGHSLEVGTIGRVVTWTNPRTNVVYRLKPVRDLPGGCRVFDYQAGPRGRLVQMTACRTATAAWTIRQR